MQGTHVFRFVL